MTDLEVIKLLEKKVDRGIPLVQKKNKHKRPGYVEHEGRVVEISFHNRKLKRFTEEIQQLDALESLSLFGNPSLDFVDVLSKLASLPKLKTLNLGINQLKELPSGILKLNSLTHLILSGNGDLNYTDTFEKLAGLKNLRKLELWGFHNLVSSGGFVALCKLSNLEGLDLLVSKLVEIPVDIGNLKNLKILSLSANNLSSLPREITELDNLQKLILSHNRINASSREMLDFWAIGTGCEIIW